MMGDGEHINMVFKTGSMMDVGTRYKFLAELYDLWETGINIIERYDKYTPGSTEKKKELEIALKMLGYHMEKDYTEKEIKGVIDALPEHGEDIKD
jgi:N-acetyl-anhydromuramyl-L-alanine amidase AmpD